MNNNNTSVMAQFKEVSCQENGTPAPETPNMYKENIGHLADKLGMSDKCKRLATTKTAVNTKTNQVKAKVGPFGMFGSGGGRNTKTSTTIDDSFAEEGCGNVIQDTKNIMNAVANMNCSISQSSSESSIATSASATVSIKVKPPPGYMQRLVDSYDLQANNMRMIAESTFIPAKERKSMMQEILAGMRLTQQTMQQTGALTLTNSRVRASANTKVKSITTSTAELSKKLEADYKDIARTSAEHNIQKKLGKNALQPSTKMLIDETVQNYTSDISNEISQTLASCNVKVENSSLVEIEVPTAVKLDNSEITADVMIDIATSTIATQSIDLGKQIAQQMLVESATKTKEEVESVGLEPLVEAQQEGVKNTIAESIKGFDTDFMDLIMQVALLGGIAFVLFKMFQSSPKGRAASGGMSMTRKFSCFVDSANVLCADGKTRAICDIAKGSVVMGWSAIENVFEANPRPMCVVDVEVHHVPKSECFAPCMEGCDVLEPFATTNHCFAASNGTWVAHKPEDAAQELQDCATGAPAPHVGRISGGTRLLGYSVEHQHTTSARVTGLAGDGADDEMVSVRNLVLEGNACAAYIVNGFVVMD